MKTAIKIVSGIVGVYLLMKLFKNKKVNVADGKLVITEKENKSLIENIKPINGKFNLPSGTVIDYGIITNGGVIVKSTKMPEIDNSFIPIKNVKIISVVSRENELPEETKIIESKVNQYYNSGVVNPSIDKERVSIRDGVLFIKNPSYTSNGFEVRKGAYVIFELTNDVSIKPLSQIKDNEEVFGYAKNNNTQYLPVVKGYTNPQAFINDNFLK